MRTVLHLLPSAMARGAQVPAGTFVSHLDGRPDRHVVVTIFAEPDHPSIPVDLALDVSPSRRRFGVDPVAVLATRRAFRRFRPNVVMAWGGEPLKYAVLTGTRAPLLYYKIGVSPNRLGRPGHLQLYRALTARAALTAGIAHEAVTEAIDLLKVPRAKTRYLPNPRDPEPFLSAAPDIDDRPSTAAFVGHLSSTKRPEVFVEVVARARRLGADIDAVIAGSGPLQPQVEAAAAAVGGIRVLGRRDDIPAVLAGCGMFVFPSIPEGEGMPGVLIEAGFAGLPTIATRTPGADTVVDHGTSGYVVDVDDIDGLAEAVARLAGDAELRAKMGAAARARCLEEFTISQVAPRLEAMVDELAPR